MGCLNTDNTCNLERLSVSSRTVCSPIFHPDSDRPACHPKPRTPGAGAGRIWPGCHSPIHFGLLRGCPLLETLLMTDSRVRENPALDDPPVPLPRLRSIELGEDEIRSGLTTRLQLPKNVAVAFGCYFCPMCTVILRSQL